MDELNVQQLWGISPFLDLLQLAGSVEQQQQASKPQDGATTAAAADGDTTRVLQVCPYDCRHTLAIISNHAGRSRADSLNAQHSPQQLELYVYETEVEGLARHMLLLMLLFDGSFTAQGRAEMFLELHGNALLRQQTADWVCAASRWLEAAIAGQPQPQQQQQQQQQQEPNPAEMVLRMFDCSLLKYKEKDALLETFQQYRSKACFDMAAAWEGRCRKWYGDRYDFRTNLVDWDYHMRLAQRGTPFMDPAAGSIIHFYHFRHWRLSGVAYELRQSSYAATNTSMLGTAYGRTKEYKDRYLRDVGRSVSAYGYWGDVLNPPYHAFGTMSDDPGLFKQVNKQFSHTSVDVAEHNLLGFIKQLCGTTASSAAAAAADADAPAAATASDGAGGQAHRARAARGPTSMDELAAAAQQQQQQQEQEENVGQQQQRDSATGGSGSSSTGSVAREALAGPVQEGPCQAAPCDATAAADQVTNHLQGVSLQKQQAQQQQQQQQGVTQQTAAEAAQLAAAVQALLGSVKVFLLTGDLKRCLTGKAGYAQRFAAASVGHRHVHLLGPEGGLAEVMQPTAPVFVETAANMVQLGREQAAAFEERLLELAAAAGFRRHPAFGSATQQAVAGYEEQGQPAGAAAAAAAPVQRQQQSGGEQAARKALGGCWRLPPGHLALCLEEQ